MVPSHVEPFGLVTVEAMATGLPVMGIRSVGVGDTVENGVTGFLAENDPASFAAKLTRLCLDKTLRRKMSAMAASHRRAGCSGLGVLEPTFWIIPCCSEAPPPQSHARLQAKAARFQWLAAILGFG